MESGKTVSLLVETFRIFSLDRRPIESGKVSRIFPETFNSTRSCSPAIESGIACWIVVRQSETQKLSFCKIHYVSLTKSSKIMQLEP